jgi:hypothetical protein
LARGRHREGQCDQERDVEVLGRDGQQDRDQTDDEGRDLGDLDLLLLGGLAVA